MTTATKGRRLLGLGGRLVGLAVVTGLTWAAAHHAIPGEDGAASVAALGFLLLAGNLVAQLIDPLGLPHLTGYLAAGIIAGPSVLGLISSPTVLRLQQVNGLAIALIALSAGAELTTSTLRTSLRSLASGTLAQTVVLLPALAATFYLLKPWMPFLSAQGPRVVLALALLWGVLAVVKSPAAVLGVLSETGAAGPLTTYAIGMVVVLDIVVLVVFQLVMVVSSHLIDSSSAFSLGAVIDVGRELVSSLALGTTLGLVTGLYLAWVDRGVLLFLVAVAFGFAQLDRYFGYDAMLVFAVAGFVVQNLTAQGKKLLKAIHQSGSVIFVIFFASAGAHLDLGALRALWPVALVLASVRGVATAVANRTSAKLSGDSAPVLRWGWAPLISQAGVALGIAVAAAASFPGIGGSFQSLAVAVVGLNEAVGPIVFKLALGWAGELGKAVHQPGSSAPISHG